MWSSLQLMRDPDAYARTLVSAGWETRVLAVTLSSSLSRISKNALCDTANSEVLYV